MRKGITPIISIIVLLLITVALAGAAWTYLSGFMGTYTEKSFIVISGSLYCSTGTISMTIKNMGTTDLTPASDFIENKILDATGTNVGSLTGVAINPKGTGTLTANCGGSTCSAGGYTVRLGTTAGMQSFSVVC